MAVIGRVTKQPADRIDYDIDCSGLLGAGDYVVSVTATVTPSVAAPDGLTVNAVVSTAKRVKLWLEYGTSGVTYKVEVKVTTYDNRIKEDEVKVRVKEV